MYGREKNARINVPIGWVAVQLFDYHDRLITGKKSLYLWPDQAANPIGTLVDNSTHRAKGINKLLIEFDTHCADVVFDSVEPSPRKCSSHFTPRSHVLYSTHFSSFTHLFVVLYFSNSSFETWSITTPIDKRNQRHPSHRYDNISRSSLPLIFTHVFICVYVGIRFTLVSFSYWERTSLVISLLPCNHSQFSEKTSSVCDMDRSIRSSWYVSVSSLFSLPHPPILFFILHHFSFVVSQDFFVFGNP